MKPIATVFLILISLQVRSQELFFSEFTPDGTRSVLELFNPRGEELDLSGYSVRFSFNGQDFPTNPLDNKYYDLQGFLASNATFVFAGKDAPEQSKLIADAVLDDGSEPGQYILHFYSDDALGLFKNDTLIDIIGKEGIRQVWDVAGVYAVTEHYPGGAKTIIRKPFIYKGNVNWDDARGYVEDLGETVADSSEWLVLDKYFSDLGTHRFISPDSALIWSSWFEVSSGNTVDTIYYVPPDYTAHDLKSKINFLPGAELEFLRDDTLLELDVPLKEDDELRVWNLNKSRYKSYSIVIGFYNYTKESPYISEVMNAGLLRAIEVFNPTAEDYDLTGWGVAIDDAVSSSGANEYTAFPPGTVVSPGETFVIGYIYDVAVDTPSANVETYADFVIPYFDLYEKGAANENVLSKLKSISSLTLLDENDSIVDRFQQGNKEATIDGMEKAFDMATLKRRSFVRHGEPFWLTEKEANPETSTWDWNPATYTDLGKHQITPTDTAWVTSGVYHVSNYASGDSIWPVERGVSKMEFMNNIHISSVWHQELSNGGMILAEDDPILEGTCLKVYSLDLSYSRSYKIVFGNDDLSIHSDILDISGDTIFCPDLYFTSEDISGQITPPEGGTMEVVNGHGNKRKGFIYPGDRLLVTAEDRSQKYYYLFFSLPDNYTLIRSPFYNIDTLNNLISGIPENKGYNLIKQNLILTQGQNIQIVDKNNSVPEIARTGDVVKIISTDGTIREYAVQTENVRPTKQIDQDVLPTTLPPGLKRSDVYLRSLRQRHMNNYLGPVNPESGKRWRTFDALYGFHCTNLNWIYSSSDDRNGFIDEVEGAGFTYQGTINPHGNLLQGDNYYEPVKGIAGDQVCPNKPGTVSEYFNRIREYLEYGSEGYSFQSDGATWLMPDRLDNILVCRCDYCDEKRSKKGISSPVSDDGKQFMLNSMLELLDSVYRHFEDSLGHKINWTGNNSSRHTMNEIIKKGYNTAYGEVIASANYSNPSKWRDDIRTAERNGLMQIFQLCSKEIDDDRYSDDVLNTEQYDKFLCVNRAHYAFSYAAGGMASVPWDSYTGTNQTRHFGLLSEFADLSGFVRAMANYIDGYESAYDYYKASGNYVGPSLIDGRFDASNAPLEVEGNDDAAIFIRVHPEDSLSPVMVHLTEWFHVYESDDYYEPFKFLTRKPYTLKLRKSSFFDGSPFTVKLVTPAEYNKAQHQLSEAHAGSMLRQNQLRGPEQSMAYQNLVIEEYVELNHTEEFVEVIIPRFPHYAMLKLEKSLPVSEMISSPEMKICGTEVFVKEDLKVEELLASVNTSSVLAVQVQDSLGFQKFSGKVVNGDLLAVLGKDQSCSTYRIRIGEIISGVQLNYNNAMLPDAYELNVPPILQGDTVHLSFDIINNRGSELILSDVISNNEMIKIVDAPELISADGSGEMTIQIQGAGRGDLYGEVWFSTNDCEELPFRFTIHTEVKHSDILIRYEKRELENKDMIEPGSKKVGESLTSSLEIHNYGNTGLLVKDIRSGSQNMQFSESQFIVEPAQKKSVLFSVPLLEHGLISDIITIQSNSTSEDSIFEINVQLIARGAKLSVIREEEKLDNGDTLYFNESEIAEKGSFRVHLLNEGNEDLMISNITSGSEHYTVKEVPSLIPVGTSDSFNIVFESDETGIFFDSINIASNSYIDEAFTLYISYSIISSSKDRILQLPEIYPNPARNYIEIKNAANFDILHIVDVNGRVLINREITEPEFGLDIESLVEGIYSIHLRNKHEIKILQFIKYK